MDREIVPFIHGEKDMQLIRHHTPEGYRCGVVVKEGRKWIHFHYVADPRPRRLPKSEARYFTQLGDVTPKQRRQFNKAARAFGGKRGSI
jgi:hypothetical protein